MTYPQPDDVLANSQGLLYRVDYDESDYVTPIQFNAIHRDGTDRNAPSFTSNGQRTLEDLKMTKVGHIRRVTKEYIHFNATEREIKA